MKPSDKLKEIENWAKDNYPPLSEAGLRVADVKWLINRVKRLTAALEEINCGSDGLNCDCMIAKKALEEE